MIDLGEVEKKMVEAMSEKVFADSSEQQARKSAELIVTFASAMYGCSLPQTEYFLNILILEVSEFLRGYYSEYTENEVFLALRVNYVFSDMKTIGLDQQVVFTGNTFNLAFLAKIVSNYAQLKYNLIRRFQNAIEGY